MKIINQIIIFILILFIFDLFLYGQNNNYEIYLGIGNSFGYTNSAEIYDHMWFNIDFGDIFYIYEEDYNYYFPVDFYIGLILDKKYFYFSAEVEISNFFSTNNLILGFLNYFKFGTGIYYKYGRLILRAGCYTGIGYYLLKIFSVSNIGNSEFVGEILFDGFIFIEPKVSIGLQLTPNFIIYLGKNIQWGLFFTKQLKEFAPSNIFLMISIII